MLTNDAKASDLILVVPILKSEFRWLSPNRDLLFDFLNVHARKYLFTYKISSKLLGRNKIKTAHCIQYCKLYTTGICKMHTVYTKIRFNKLICILLVAHRKKKFGHHRAIANNFHFYYLVICRAGIAINFALFSKACCAILV